MRIWGLTGGIASGKSTVARLLAKKGLPVVDADALYHQLIAPVLGPSPASAHSAPSLLAQQIAAAFPGTLNADGSLNRQALSSIVFRSPASRSKLEAISHPPVAKAAQAAFHELAAAGHQHAVYDVPLLYERNLVGQFAGVIVVWVPQGVQLARLCARDGHQKEVALQRISAQLPLDLKRLQATYVIDNSGSQGETEQQTMALMRTLYAQ